MEFKAAQNANRTHLWSWPMAGDGLDPRALFSRDAALGQRLAARLESWQADQLPTRVRRLLLAVNGDLPLENVVFYM